MSLAATARRSCTLSRRLCSPNRAGDVYIPHADNWVAAEGDTILGFIGLVDNHVGGLFVAPAAHRRGVGRLLLDDASGRLGELTVEVYVQNRPACSFYGSCGFDPIGRKELDDEGRALPLLRMKRDPAPISRAQTEP